MKRKMIYLKSGKRKCIIAGKKYEFCYKIKDDQGRRKSHIKREMRTCVGVYRNFATFLNKAGWNESFNYQELQEVIEGGGNYELESWR